MKSKPRNMRRFGGRWVSDDTRYQDRHSTLKAVVSRFWYLLVPLVGITWADSAYVRPDVEAIKSQRNREIAKTMDRQDQIRAQVTDLHSEIATLEAEIDTLHMPLVVMRQTVYDSLSLVRKQLDRNPEILNAAIDSLAILRDYLAADIDRLAREYEAQNAILANLGEWETTLQDSMVTLDRNLATVSAELARWEQRKHSQDVFSRFWYVLGPCLGVIWAQDS